MYNPTLLSRRSALALIGATAASSSFASAKPLTLADVISLNTKARGGAGALDRVHSVAIDVEIDEGGQKLNGRYAANTAGLVRIDIYVGGKFAGAEGIDGDGVWTWGKDGPEPSIATGAADALQHGAEDKLYGWSRFAKRGHSLALMPSQTVDGVTYPVVKVRYSTGHISYFYVDPVSWHAVRRRDERAFHPDNDLTKKRVETRFSDFVSVDGVAAPHMDKDYDLGASRLLATHRVLSRRMNTNLAPDHFDRDRRPAASWA